MSESLQKQEAELHSVWMQSLQGDSASYQRALGLMSSHVRRFLQKRMPSQLSDVEDLVQETLMAIHQKRHTYQSDQPLTAWMYAIARYKWVDHLRAHGRREGLHDDIDDWSETLAVDSDEAASDTHKDLDVMLARFGNTFIELIHSLNFLPYLEQLFNPVVLESIRKIAERIA